MSFTLFQQVHEHSEWSLELSSLVLIEYQHLCIPVLVDVIACQQQHCTVHRNHY